MSTSVFIHDLKEANGKTVKENNLEKSHAIPLGALVEIDCDYNESHGLRLFVVEHSRDCDGSPLYVLSMFSLDKHRETSQWINNLVVSDESRGMNGLTYRKGFLLHLIQNDGWSDEALKVIKLPS